MKRIALSSVLPLLSSGRVFVGGYSSNRGWFINYGADITNYDNLDV